MAEPDPKPAPEPAKKAGGDPAPDPQGRSYTDEEIAKIRKDSSDDGFRMGEKKNRERMRDLGLSSDEDIRRAQEALKKQEELDRTALESKGEYERLRAKDQEEHEKEKAKLAEDITAGNVKLDRLMIRDPLMTALSDSKAIRPSECADLIMMSGKLKRDGEAVKVVDADGDALFKEGKPVTLAQFVAGWLEERPDRVHDGMAPGTGDGDATTRAKGTVDAPALMAEIKSNPLLLEDAGVDRASTNYAVDSSDANLNALRAAIEKAKSA